MKSCLMFLSKTYIITFDNFFSLNTYIKNRGTHVILLWFSFFIFKKISRTILKILYEIFGIPKKKKDYEYVQLCYGKIVMRNAYVVFH
jgi:hypothetical protein